DRLRRRRGGDRSERRGLPGVERPPPGLLEAVRDAAGPNGPGRPAREADDTVEVLGDALRVIGPARRGLPQHRAVRTDDAWAVRHERQGVRIEDADDVGADRLAEIVDAHDSAE